MRFLLLLALTFCFTISAFGHEEHIEHVHSADIAAVKSSINVQGTIVLDRKGKLPNSAVVNQTAVWEGSTYTYNPQTGKIYIRAKRDTKHKLPALTIVKVENRKVTFSYIDGKMKKAVVFTKKMWNGRPPEKKEKTGKRI